MKFTTSFTNRKLPKLTTHSLKFYIAFNESKNNEIKNLSVKELLQY